MSTVVGGPKVDPIEATSKGGCFECGHELALVCPKCAEIGPHAARLSDYADVVKYARKYGGEGHCYSPELDRRISFNDLADAIEALEAKRDTLHKCCVEYRDRVRDQVRRAEAAEAERDQLRGEGGRIRNVRQKAISYGGRSGARTQPARKHVSEHQRRHC